MQRSQDHSVHDALEKNRFAVYLGNSSRPFARFQSSCCNQPTTGEWKHNGRTLLPLCICAASALPLLCLRMRCETGVNQALLKRSLWKRLSSPDQWNLSPMKQTLWSSADHALAQVRPRQIFTRALSKNGRSLEPCCCLFIDNLIILFKSIWFSGLHIFSG